MSESPTRSQGLGWLPGAGTALSLLTCYGTLALVALLSIMGVTLVINLQIWAALIVAFAFLALLGIFVGRRVHGGSGPTLVALSGTVLVTLSMYATGVLEEQLGLDRDLVEVTGFAVLVVATMWDWRLRRSA